MKKRIILMLLAALLCLGFVSCDVKKRYTKESYGYFDTVTVIIGYEKSEDEFEKRCEEIFALLDEYHKLYDIYNKYDGLENIYTINERSGAASLDVRIIDLLDYSKKAHGLSLGKVNIAMGSVLEIWHDYREKGVALPDKAELPDKEILLSAAEHTDINSVVIDREGSSVTLSDIGTKLDVGAVAKGYAVERIAEMLEAEGVTGYTLNVGGNVRTIGAKPDGEKWCVGIEDPAGGGDCVAYLYLSGESLVTSGAYQRYYEVDGKRYHHIIDPDTLYPASGYLSVSVVSKSSADADVLSTALFCADLEKGREILDNYPDAEAMWVRSDGEKIFSDGFERYMKK